MADSAPPARRRPPPKLQPSGSDLESDKALKVNVKPHEAPDIEEAQQDEDLEQDQDQEAEAEQERPATAGDVLAMLV